MITVQFPKVLEENNKISAHSSTSNGPVSLAKECCRLLSYFYHKYCVTYQVNYSKKHTIGKVSQKENIFQELFLIIWISK